MLQVLYYQGQSIYDYYRESSDSLLLRDKTAAHLTDLNLSKSAETVVLIPSHIQRIFELELPKMSRSQMQKAVPFALEEQLAEDLTSLHFALGHKQKSKQTVGVISKNIMEDILHGLATINIQPTAIIPDFLALPHKAEHWSIYQNAHSLVRQNQNMGYAIATELLEKLLQQKLQDQKDNIHVDLYAKKEHKISALPQLAIAFHPVEEFPIDIASIEKPALNYLQAPYKSKRAKRQGKINYWWVAAGSVASFIVVSLLIKTITYAVIHHKSTNIDQQVLAQYQQLFPGSTSVVEPRYQIGKLLAQLSSNKSSNPFLKLLAALGQAMNHNANLQLINLQFEKGALTADISANQLSSIETIARILQNQGVKVSQNQVKPGKHKVSAQLTLTEGG